MHPLLRPANVVIAGARRRRHRPGHRGGRRPHRDDRASCADRLAVGLLDRRVVAPLPRAGSRATGQFKGEASHVFGFFTTDTNLTWQQIGADLLSGETLDQIAGAHAAKVEADALAEVTRRALRSVSSRA